MPNQPLERSGARAEIGYRNWRLAPARSTAGRSAAVMVHRLRCVVAFAYLAVAPIVASASSEEFISFVEFIRKVDQDQVRAVDMESGSDMVTGTMADEKGERRFRTWLGSPARDQSLRELLDRHGVAVTIKQTDSAWREGSFAAFALLNLLAEMVLPIVLVVLLLVVYRRLSRLERRVERFSGERDDRAG